MGIFETLSFSVAERSACLNGKLCHKGLQCARRPEVDSAGYLVVHVLHKVDPCGGPHRKPSSLKVRPPLC